MRNLTPAPLAAIACGGTGGHLFPGITVAEALDARGFDVLLLVSPKDIDQQAVQSLPGMQAATLPGAGLERGRRLASVLGFARSLASAYGLFLRRRPRVVITMGAFTGAAPLLVGKLRGAVTVLHEANSIPGRANRWLAPLVDLAFVFFPGAAARLRHSNPQVVGMPIRSQFGVGDAASCRIALGLEPQKPVLVITGGSQGARSLNRAVLRALPSMGMLWPDLQYLHLTGAIDFEPTRSAYASQPCRAIVRPFLTEMELALGAATAVISRAGASSVAELAALRVPSLLVPYPAAADNHQHFNAHAYGESGAALTLAQKDASPVAIVDALRTLIADDAARTRMKAALAAWHHPDAADRIACAVAEKTGIARSQAGAACAPATAVNARVPSLKASAET